MHGNPFLDRFFEETPMPLNDNAKQRFVHAERWLRRADIRTTGQLLRDYCRMPTDVQFVALLVIRYHRRRTAVPLLMRELANSDPLIAGAASAALANIGGDRVLSRLLRLFKDSSSKPLRRNIVSALACIRDIRQRAVAVNSLIGVLSRSEEDPEVQATAAEGLAYLGFPLSRDSRLRQRIEVELIDALTSSNCSVRCCATHALGELRVKRAVPQLRALARTDRSMCPGLGSVSEVAAAAIRQISRS
jgi:HEAT repeat protein